MNSTDTEEAKLKAENEMLRFELSTANKMAAADDASMDALEQIIDKKDVRITRKQWIITGVWILVYAATDALAILHNSWAPFCTPIGLAGAWYLGMAYQRAAKPKSHGYWPPKAKEGK